MPAASWGGPSRDRSPREVTAMYARVGVLGKSVLRHPLSIQDQLSPIFLF